jgi:hypothetical protein
MAGIARSAWVVLASGFVAVLGVIAFGFTDAGFFGFGQQFLSVLRVFYSLFWSA